MAEQRSPGDDEELEDLELEEDEDAAITERVRGGRARAISIP